MLNNDSKALVEILEIEKIANDVKGIRFDYSSMKKEEKYSTKKFVPLRRKSRF